MHTLRLSVASLALLIAPFAFAHSDQPSHEHTVSGYIVDVGYTTATPVAGQEVLFNFDLFTGTGDDLLFADFDTVYLTVAQGDTAVAQKIIHNAPPDVPTLSYAFPAPGQYDITVAYNSKDHKELVRDSFPMTVGSDTKDGASDIYLIDALIIIVICGVFYVLRKRILR